MRIRYLRANSPRNLPLPGALIGRFDPLVCQCAFMNIDCALRSAFLSSFPSIFLPPCFLVSRKTPDGISFPSEFEHECRQ